MHSVPRHARPAEEVDDRLLPLERTGPVADDLEEDLGLEDGLPEAELPAAPCAEEAEEADDGQTTQHAGQLLPLTLMQETVHPGGGFGPPHTELDDEDLEELDTLLALEG